MGGRLSRLFMAAGLLVITITSVSTGTVHQASAGTTRTLVPPNASGSTDDAKMQPDAPPERAVSARLLHQPRSATSSTLVEVVGDQRSAASEVERVGGQIVSSGTGITLASVPSRRLSELDSSASLHVRTPVTTAERAFSPTTTRAGAVSTVSVLGVPEWQRTGYRGAGAKVGLLGLFDTTVLASQTAAGEVAPIPNERRVCVSAGAFCPFGTPDATFGNSLAEAFTDSAPDAQLFLAELGYLNDYYPIIDWFAANGVSIVIHPFVWPYDGQGNGTGLAAAIVDYAVSKGITWINTGGDMSPDGARGSFDGTYWAGTWADPDNDRWLNFRNTDESMSVYCGYFLGMRWDDWTGGATDYDLWISDYNASTRVNGTRKLLSARNQAAGAAPLEATEGLRLCNSDPARGAVYDTNKDGFVSLWVQRTTRSAETPVGDRIELGAYYGFLEYSTYNGSAAIAFADSANPGMLTIGTDNTRETYLGGGAGPTTDGRIKPDLVSDPCVGTSVDGVSEYCVTAGYYGSDAAATLVAGAAAVARSALGMTRPEQLARYMRDQGDGAIYGFPPVNGGGWGRSRLPDAPPPTWTPGGLHKQTVWQRRVLDTRPSPTGPIGVPVAGKLVAGQTYRLRVAGGSLLALYPVLNITVIDPAGPGYVQVFPQGYSYPGASASITMDTAGQVRSNTAIVAIGDQGFIDVFSSTDAHVVIDLVGMFSSNDDERLHPMTPHRVLDTEACLGISPCTGALLPESTWTDVTVRGDVDPSEPRNRVPADATAVAVVITVKGTSDRGFVTAAAGGVRTISYSSLNHDAGIPASGMAIVHLDENGRFSIFNRRAAHLQVELVGWFASDFFGGGKFVPAGPARAIDTRLPTGSPPIPARSLLPIPLDSTGIPANTLAVAGNLTAIRASAAGDVRLGSPPDPDRAYRTMVVGSPGQTVSNNTIATLGASAGLLADTSAHWAFDVSGYFTATPAPVLGPDETGRIPFSGNVRNISVSDDGRVVAWVGEGPQVQGPDPYNRDDIFVWDAVTNSLRSFDIENNESAFDLSGDGSTLVAHKMYPGPLVNVWQLVAVDVSSGGVTVVSLPDDDVQIPTEGNGSFHVSDDGDIVAFTTATPLHPADDDGTYSAYLRTRSTGTTQYLGPAHTVVLSDDGSHVAWALSTQVSWTVRGSGQVRTVPPTTEQFALQNMSPNGRYITSFVPYQSSHTIDTTTNSYVRPNPCGGFGDFVGNERFLVVDQGAHLCAFSSGAQGRLDQRWDGGYPTYGTTAAAVSDDGSTFVFWNSYTDITGFGPSKDLYVRTIDLATLLP